MLTKKKRKLLIISIVIAVILILISIFVVLYLTTDMFKSNQTLFMKYIAKNAENFAQVQEINMPQKYESYNEKTDIKVNYITNVGTTSENTDNNINNLSLKVEGKRDENPQYDYKKIQLLQKNNAEMTVEYVKNNDNYGLHFNDLFNQYIVVQNSDLKGLFDKLGYTDEIIANIPNQINIEESVNQLKFTEEELMVLQEKYINLLAINVSGNNFGKEPSAIITIGNNKVATNAYSLTLTKEQLNSLYVKILEEVKKDEIILSKLDKVQEIYNILTLGNSNNINVKQVIIEKIENKIKEINSNNIGTETNKVIVYEADGQTIRTTIQTTEYETSLDYLNVNGEKYINLSKSKNKNNVENITCEISQNKNVIIIENNEEQNPKTIKYEYVTENDGSNINNQYVLMYNDKTQKAELDINQKLEKTEETKEKVEFSSENSVNLTMLERAHVKQIVEQAKKGLEEKIKQVKENVKAEDIENMLESIGIIKDGTILNSTGVTEAERNRFNSKFELLQGEKIPSENLITIIDTIKNNIIDMKVVSNEELKLELDKTKGNEEISEVLKEFLSKDKNATYNIKIEYDENKLAKYINLTIAPRN